jgi:hypothetical protein
MLRMITTLASFLAAAPALADGPVEYRGYEAPAYSVVDTLGPIEIRDYPALTVAEVTVRGGFTRAAGRGFRTLADYIFGANAGAEKIAMTVPVEQSPAGEGMWTIRFVAPRGETPASLPAPESPAIRLVRTEPGRQAALRFSGLASAGVVRERSAALLSALDAAGRTPAGPVVVYYYDDPFTLPWRRRNEVAVPIAD